MNWEVHVLHADAFSVESVDNVLLRVNVLVPNKRSSFKPRFEVHQCTEEFELHFVVHGAFEFKEVAVDAESLENFAP